MVSNELQSLLDELDHCVVFTNGKIQIQDKTKVRNNAIKLARISALGEGIQQGYARYLTRAIALELGIFPASIYAFYIAKGQGKTSHSFTVPAINLRILPFHAARAAFHVAREMNANAIIFEIARSEIGYTNQRPSEYATNIIAAAIADEYRGPVFLQGDHFQVSQKKYATDPQTEIQAIQDLIAEAVLAGFFNIDIDTSTLVDLSKTNVAEQQTLNYSLSAQLTAFTRSIEPEGVTISVGGEIGEVGGHNSTEEELRAYLNGYNQTLRTLGEDMKGLSKISIQTGTSHGGVVLADGSIAHVTLDFDTLHNLGKITREEYHMGGAVQHGASTLPQDAFGKFSDVDACEVHLATNFQNIFFEKIDPTTKNEMYAYLDENFAHERKPGMTADQFYYKSRKQAIGPFKSLIWKLPDEDIQRVTAAWEQQFSQIFTAFRLADSRNQISRFIKPGKVVPDKAVYLSGWQISEDVSDLAD